MKIPLKLFTIFALVAGMLACGRAAHAQERPDQLVSRISQEVLAIARTDPEIQSGNRERIMKLVEAKIVPHSDFRRATALVTGRYWRRATPEQKQRLTEEFRRLLMFTYSGAMSQVQDQRIDVKPLRAASGDDDVVVDSEFRKSRGAEPVQVSYRLAKTPDGWKIYDVNVMGIWMGLTYQNMFADEIRRSGIDGLIDALSERNRNLAAGTE